MQIIRSYLVTVSMDNPAMKDDAMQSNSTDPRSKDLVRMESVVNSVTSTQELIDASAAANFHTNSKAGKIRAMISSSTKRLLVAIIFLLSMAVLVLAALYILKYHERKESVIPSTTKVCLFNSVFSCLLQNSLSCFLSLNCCVKGAVKSEL